MGVHRLTNTFHPSKSLQISLYFVDPCCHDKCSTCDVHLIKDTILKQSSLVSSDKNISLFTNLPNSQQAMVERQCAAQISFLSHEIKVVTTSA